MVALVVVALFIPLSLIVRSIQIDAWENHTLYRNILMLIAIVVILLADLLFFSFVIHRIMFPKLKIFENGITRFITPILTDRDGDFIPFSEVESFSISSNRLTCAIMLTDTEFPLIWTSYDPNHILPIIEAVKKNNIPEVN